MKEQLIEFETAKLAKQKGFDWCSHSYYDFIGTECYHITNENTNKSNESIYTAPTQSLLQKWLRKEHKIFVNPIPNFKIKYGQHNLGIVFENDEAWVVLRFTEIILKESDGNLKGINKLFDTYEQALEAGLIEALKLI